MRKGWVLTLVVVACGCGFQSLPQGADMGSDAGADLSPSGPTGPGPLGALPAGYCCTAGDQCRSRHCLALGGGPSFCSDECRSDEVCNVWGGEFVCYMMDDTCVAKNQTYDCLDPATYVRGTKPTGSCCTPGHAKAGQECEGGLCMSTGPTSNPFFCTQGCSATSPCPPGYACNAGSWCWKIDPNAPYTCDP